MNIPTIDGLSAQEQTLYSAMVNNWSRNLGKNGERMAHYAGKVHVSRLDLGISIPPPILKKLDRQSVMWSKKAVDALADCSAFDGFSFVGNAPEGFDDAMQAAQIGDLYDDAKTAELIHCCAAWTVTPGGEGERPVIVNVYDAEHSSWLWDYRNRRILAGIAIVDVDPKHPDRPTAVNMYLSDCTIECKLTDRGWKSNRIDHSVGRPLMEPMRYNPSVGKPFGRSRITPAVMEIENDANREVVKMIMHSELYTAPTHWVMGAPDDIFDNGRWQAYFGSIFALPRDENFDAPATGSYPVGDMSPHIALMRQFANMLAAETSIPVHSLMYTEANPASSEAIEAGEHDLIQKAQDMNRRNGEALRNVGLIACSLLVETPFDKLDADILSLSVRWKNPKHTSLVSLADANCKLATISPEYAQTRVFWESNGFDDSTIDRIMADFNKTRGMNLLASVEVTYDNDTEAVSDEV